MHITTNYIIFNHYRTFKIHLVFLAIFQHSYLKILSHRDFIFQMEKFNPFQYGHKTKINTGKWSEVAQLCLTLCNPMDCSLPGSSIHGIFQARILEWVAISFSRRSSWPRDWTQVSRIIGRRFTIWATREATCYGAWPKNIERKNEVSEVLAADLPFLLKSSHQQWTTQYRLNL